MWQTAPYIYSRGCSEYIHNHGVIRPAHAHGRQFGERSLRHGVERVDNNAHIKNIPTQHITVYIYEVAMNRRLLENIGLFCRK